MHLRFEGAATNLFNYPNLAPAATDVTSPRFGAVTSVQTAENGGNRSGQRSLRLEF